MSGEQGASVEALETAYREGFHRYVRVASAITRSRESAVDAVQDAFASLLRSRAGYRGTGTLEAWAWRAVLNAARKASRARAGEELGAEMPAHAHADDDGVDEVVRAAIRGLPARQRETLFLRYYADLDYRAIAAALEIDIGTVGSTLHQAQAALRSQLEEARTR